MGINRRSFTASTLGHNSVPIESLEARTLLSALPPFLTLGHSFFTSSPSASAPLNSVTQITPVSVTIHPWVGVSIKTDVGVIRGLAASLLPRLTATIDWGDSTPASAGRLHFDAAGRLRVSGMHTYAAAGIFALQISVVQNPPKGSLQLSRLYTIHSKAQVSQQPALGGVTIHPAVSQPFSAVVGTFIAPETTPSTDAQSYMQRLLTAGIAWGDGRSSAGSIQLDSSGRYSVVANHTYRAAGTFKITVNVGGRWGLRPGSPAGLNVPMYTWTVTTISSTAIVTPGPLAS